MKSNRIGLYISLFFLFPSFCIASSLTDDSLVNFKILCEDSNKDCSKFILPDTKKEILLQNTPVITLADVESAEAVTKENSAKRIAYLESKGLSEDEAKKRMYGLILKFKTPHIFYKITSQNIGKTIAIFINNELVSAPVIKMPIPNNATPPMGDMTKEKAELFATKINAAIKSDSSVK